MTSALLSPLNPSGTSVNVTAFDLQSGVQWSKDMQYTLNTGRAVLADWPSEDALLVSTFVLDSAQNKVLTKLDRSGNVIWSRRYGSAADIFPNNIGHNRSIPLDDGTAILAGGAFRLSSNLGRNDVYIARVNAAGILLWARNLCFQCLSGADAAFGDVVQTRDGNFVVAGTVDADQGLSERRVLLVKFGPNGNLLWAKTIGQPVGFDKPDADIRRLTERPNGNLVLVGFLTGTGGQDGLILETAATGDLLEARVLRLASSKHQVTINNVAVRDNASLVLSIATRQDTASAFSVELNILTSVGFGTSINWQYNYITEGTVGYITDTDVLLPLQDGGLAYLPNYAENFDNLFPFLILTDGRGENGCELPINLVIQPLPGWSVESIQPEVQALTDQSDYAPLVSNFVGYNLDLPYPELGPDTAYCTTGSILLDGTTTGISDYRWSTGDTLPTINVSTSGAYSVTVSDLSRCLQLSDTMRLGLYTTAPIATIQLDTNGFCQDSTLRLIAETTNAERISWSTGALGDTLEVDAPGVFVLTAINACGVTRDTINLKLPRCKSICPFLFPNVFTPNGDGTNDQFRPVGSCPEISNYAMKVFNRWGDLVFEGFRPEEGWNGETNGLPAPSDVYVWWAQYRLDDLNEDILVKGDVTLLR
jgi:gliding motility-associated-like protein